MPPYYSPPPKKRSPLVWVIVILVVVLALLAAAVFFVLRPSNPSPSGPTTAPATETTEPPSPTDSRTPGTWSSIELTGLNENSQVIDSDVDGIALVVTYDDDTQTTCTITAADLVNLTVLWTISSNCIDLHPSAEGLVVPQYVMDKPGQLQVIDVTTGAITATTDLASNEYVMEVGGGIVYSQTDPGSASGVTGCARDMTLGPCLWQGPGNPTYDTDESVGIFGDYSWLNTTDGVLDLRTGAHANFGSGYDQCNGPTRDHVLCDKANDTSEIFQQVDTATGQPIGPKMEPMTIVSFSDDSSTYVVLQDESGGKSHVIGYSWDTGNQVFDTTLDGQIGYPDWPVPVIAWAQVGAAFWTFYSTPSNDGEFAAFSVSSGNLLWQGGNAAMIGVTSAVGHSTVYVQDESRLTAIDADTVQPSFTTDVPGGLTATTAGNRAVAIDGASNLLWVLSA